MKDKLEKFKIHPERAKELTGVKAELYVFTYEQLKEFINENCKERTKEAYDDGFGDELYDFDYENYFEE